MLSKAALAEMQLSRLQTQNHVRYVLKPNFSRLFSLFEYSAFGVETNSVPH